MNNWTRLFTFLGYLDDRKVPAECDYRPEGLAWLVVGRRLEDVPTS
jgi:hypothetical protein